MNTDCVLILISFNNDSGLKNSIGEPIFNESEKEIYGIKKSVRQSEFYQAAAAGFKPEVVVEINSFEYSNEEICELEGQRFRVYRVYPIKNSERTELYLTELAGETDVTS